MTAYALVAIWLISGLVFWLIGKHRGIRFSAFLDIVVALFGPFSIPLAFLLKPENDHRHRK